MLTKFRPRQNAETGTYQINVSIKLHKLQTGWLVGFLKPLAPDSCHLGKRTMTDNESKGACKI